MLLPIYTYLQRGRDYSEMSVQNRALKMLTCLSDFSINKAM